MCYSITVAEVDEIRDYMIWFPSVTKQLQRKLKDLVMSLDQRARIVPKDNPVIHLSKEEYAGVTKIKNLYKIN